MPGNRVLLVLVIAGLLGGLDLAFLVQAPNRLLSGSPIALSAAAQGARSLALMPGLILIVGTFLPQRRATHGVIAAGAAAFLVALVWLAGAHAATLAEQAPRAARTSLGGGFWVLFLCAALALIDAMQRLALPAAIDLLTGATVLGALAALGGAGALDHLSILREYATRHGVLADAVLRHAVIVVGALVPAVMLGVPLGVLARRRQRWRAILFPMLNVVQTIPSIALFGLLIAPLSGLAERFPELGIIGIGGVGLAPAIIALVLYALLPIVRNTAEGLVSVAPAAVDAARGLGMTPAQIFWRVEMPLALPVFLSGLRIATVQTVGLAAVAALIGAGGLGAIVFQGLFANALDLVLLGAVPVILLALAADAALRQLAAHARRLPT